MKIYEVMARDSYKGEKRLAVFSNKNKAFGYLVAKMDEAKRENLIIKVADKNSDRFMPIEYGYSAKNVTCCEYMFDCKVYYVKVTEVM